MSFPIGCDFIPKQSKQQAMLAQEAELIRSRSRVRSSRAVRHEGHYSHLLLALAIAGAALLGSGARAAGRAWRQAEPQPGPARANESTNCNQAKPGLGELADLDEQARPNASWPAGLPRRVSDYATPTFYTLRLHADPTRQKFSGQLMIAIDVAEPEPAGSAAGNTSEPAGHRYLALHAAENLRIKRAFYVSSARPGDLQVPASALHRLPERQLIAIDFRPHSIGAGQGLLLIVYSGQVNETDSHGLFVHHSARPAPSSNRRQATSGLATQMQPIFARRFLPAWDEPQLKARFSLIVVLPFRNYQSISNMAVKRKSISLSCAGEPLQEIEFHTTPAMSTYLLTLVVGNFDYIEAITQTNCKLRAYFYAAESPAATNQVVPLAQPEASPNLGANPKRAEAQFGLEVAVRAFDRLELLLGVRYPLQKFDMVALRDFKSGAMENWGAAVFNENFLLYQQNSSGPADTVQLFGRTTRPRGLLVPLVVAHEIVHQWFGNLVSPRSWTYLWLNEGFAQLLMYEVAHSLFPATNYWHTFLEDSRQPAMHDDELVTSSHALELHPVEPEPAPDLANNWSSLFDKITYDKGAMVVRMVWALLGREQFFAGLRHYLLKHSYGTVGSHELWQALEESTGRPERQLEALMSGWLLQEGYPLLTCQLQENATHFRLRLSQERFTLLGAGAFNQTDWFWSIPVSVASEREPEPEPGAGELLLLSDRTATAELAKLSLGRWLKLNANATGYFRVDYLLPGAGPASAGPAGQQVDALARMAPAVRAKQMGPVDRFNLVDDLFAMVLAGRKSSAYYLRYLIEAFGNESEIIVLRAIVKSLKRIRLAIVSNADGKLSGPFDRYVQAYLNQVTQSLPGLAERGDGLVPAGPSNNELKEIGDLIAASRIVFNERAHIRRASELLNASLAATGSHVSQPLAKDEPNFRPALSRAPFDSMDREMRASIYSAALAHAANQPDLEQDAPLPVNGSLQQSAPGSDVFLSLVQAYESAETSGHRWAICAALGSVEQPNKRLKLLNLALFGSYFRPADVAPLLESMGRSRAGRELVMGALNSDARLIERRLLLPAALKSLQGGLVESGQTERQLRALYATFSADYGKLIGQTVELLLVNSNWLKRDRAGLARFLETTAQSSG